MWDYGEDRSPRSDGFKFAFVKNLWDLIKPDIMASMQDF